MKLSIKGHSRRLNGPSAPIEEFEREYNDPGALGEEIALPLPECHFRLTLEGGARLFFRFDNERSETPIEMDSPITVVKERGILGVSITFELTE